MDFLSESALQSISRRNFLKLAGTSLLALFFPPLFDHGRGYVYRSQNTEEISSLGRVQNNRATLRKKPSFTADIKKYYHTDVIIPITGITLGEDNTDYNRIWYEINDGEGYAYSGNVQPVEILSNPVTRSIPENGALAEVTVPYTEARHWKSNLGHVAYRFYYSTTHWIYGYDEDDKGNPWYKVHDDKKGFIYYVKAEHMHLIPSEEIAPLSPEVPQSEKRLEIRLQDQVVVAYEEDRPVFMTRAATGARFTDGDYRTQPGEYMTNRKRPSRHMATGEPGVGSGFDLPGVPWVCYLTKSGVSIHGTFWHNDFGRPRSHGCINLSSSAARWIYRWTAPLVPTGQEVVEKEEGTFVHIV